jgi:hypothetical protein
VKGLAGGTGADAIATGEGDWRSWEIAAWNQRLLRHFFLRSVENEGPVITLLITPEELARVVGAPVALATEVRDALVHRVQRQIRRHKSLIEDATDYEWWPRPPPAEEIPHFVAHLTVTCLAAAESNEDFANENSFIVRLRELTGDQLPDPSLADLPRLWANLATWLVTDGNRRLYRSLTLPDPGGFTRIGYTIKLTFPDRRDQAELSRLLDERGLGGAEPPVASLLRLIAENRGRFRRSFLEAYQSFRHAREGAPRSPGLREHRFWVAVREAAFRGRGGTDLEELGARVQLLAEPQDERLALFIVADRPIEGHPQLATVEMTGVHYNEWTHLVVLAGVGRPGSEQHDEAVKALLAGSLRLPRLSTLVDQGLLALVAGSHGLLEIAYGDGLEASEAILVRIDLADDLAKVMHADAVRLRLSAYGGWQQTNKIALRRLPSDILDRTSLAKCWQLHEIPASVPVRLVGGVATEDGWLGYREVLPRVSAPGGKGAYLDSDDAGIETLESTRDGEWMLPVRDMRGAFEIVVDAGMGESRRTVQFYASAAGDRFRRPGDAASRMVESFDDSAPLDVDGWLCEQAGAFDAEPLCEDVAYLGCVVGEFLESPEHAACRIVRFGGTLLGFPIHKHLCVPPTAQVAEAGLRRRWWKLLNRATPAVADFETARRSLGRKFSHLPVVERRQVSPVRGGLQTPPLPDPRVERLASILAARASTRAGIPWGEWCELVGGVLDIPVEETRAVMRAWEEAGCIDVASFARWRNLAVFARQPALVAVHSGDAVRATPMGLLQGTTRADLMRAAASQGVLVDERRCLSQYVPQTLTLRAPNADAIREVGRATGVDIRWLTPDLCSWSAADPRALRQPPPMGYDPSGTWSNWSLQRDTVTAGVEVTKWTRPDRPTYWRVTSKDLDVWSYHPNHARLWACSAIGESPFDASVDCELRVRHAFLPLPLARVVAALGTALPGPDFGQRGAYRYPFVSNALRSLVLDKLRSGFKARHNAPTSSEGETCTIR